MQVLISYLGGMLPQFKGSLDPPGDIEMGSGGASDHETLSKRGRSSGGFLPKTLYIPAIQVRLGRVKEMIELCKEKALIGKFFGIWPKDKDLI